MVTTNILKAIKVQKEIETLGSAPLYVIAEDDLEYFAKPIRTSPPCLEIINEFLCSSLLKAWGLKTPEVCLIEIDLSVASQIKLSNRYQDSLFSKPFFGSKAIEGFIEVERYFHSFSKSDLNKFQNPEDLIKIGYFDLWVGNKDRKPNNPNLVISRNDDKFTLHPIDHGAAFCYHDHKVISHTNLWLDPSYSILTTGMAKAIAKELLSNGTELFWDSHINPVLKSVERDIDFIFDSIPRDLGCSSKAKSKLKEILFNEERNSELWQKATLLLS